MRPHTFGFLFLLPLGFWFLWTHAEKPWFPKPLVMARNAPVEEAKKKAEDEARKKVEDEAGDAKKNAARAVAGVAALAVDLPGKPAIAPPVPPKLPVPSVEPPTLIAFGDPSYNLQVLLSTRGAGVQQVILTKFDAADRLGREVKQKDGNGNPTDKNVPLYLIPGVPPVRGKFLREEFIPPVLKPGKVLDPKVVLVEPAYTLFHYPNPDDKDPDPLLGEENWKVVVEQRPAGGEHKVVFETELGDPYFVKLRKTFTLAPKDYHVGLKIEIERLPSGQKGKGQLRLQLSGPRGLPIEGEWYTSTYRVALVGWTDRKRVAHRQYEDAATVAAKGGGDPVTRGDNTFKYAAIATQYFTSALAVDDRAEGAGKNPWAYVRATTELPFANQANPNVPHFDDVTFRAATDVFDLAPGDKLTHDYLIYNGPAKVRLLGFMEGDRAVDPGLVERYQDRLGLRTIADFHSSTWIGKFANFISWSDLLIFSTNLMHSLLAMIHIVVPSWALSIMVLTIVVQILLLVPTRKQIQMNLKMMEVQTRLAPQLEELHKKHPDDPTTFNREKMALMMANGVNPVAAMGGCLLLFVQLPILMGLYYCLGESVFFRLEPFLWIDNLAAPDMLVWWSEKIPFISTPEDLGSFYYLGPYFNVLPLLAVGLMLWQTNKMMPPPTDKKMAQQQRMMKMMMVLMAVMFYKVAAGLALYFIITTIWSSIEWRLISRPSATTEGAANSGAT